MGDLTQKHLDSCTITLQYSIDWDDGFDILLNGSDDIKAYEDHLNNLHPNITFHVRLAGRENTLTSG